MNKLKKLVETAKTKLMEDDAKLLKKVLANLAGIAILRYDAYKRGAKDHINKVDRVVSRVYRDNDMLMWPYDNGRKLAMFEPYYITENKEEKKEEQ